MNFKNMTMKANKLIAAALLPLIFSCAKDNRPDGNGGNDNQKQEFSITVSPQTAKAGYEDGKGVVWIPGRNASILADGSAPIASAALSTISDDKFSATFTFEAEEGTYRLFYPYNGDSAYDNYCVEVPLVQNQISEGNSADIIAVLADKDVQLTTESPDVVGLTCHAVGSYIRFLVYNEAPEGGTLIPTAEDEVIEAIRISVPGSSMAGKYIVKNDGTATVSQRSEGEVRVNLSTPCAVASSASQASQIYAAVLCGDYSGVNYTVVTNKKEYKFTSTEAGAFVNGEIKDVRINLSDAPICKNLYLLGEATEIGWAENDHIEMDNVANGIFSWEGHLATGQFGLSLDKDGWGNQLRPSVENSPVGPVAVVDEKFDAVEVTGDTHWLVKVAGTYRLTVNMHTHTMSSEMIGPDAFLMWGDFNSWNFDTVVPIARAEGSDEYIWQGTLGEGGVYFLLDKSYDFMLRPEKTVNVQEPKVFTDNLDIRALDTQWYIWPGGTFKITLNWKARTVKFEVIE